MNLLIFLILLTITPTYLNASESVQFTIPLAHEAPQALFDALNADEYLTQEIIKFYQENCRIYAQTKPQEKDELFFNRKTGTYVPFRSHFKCAETRRSNIIWEVRGIALLLTTLSKSKEFKAKLDTSDPDKPAVIHYIEKLEEALDSGRRKVKLWQTMPCLHDISNF